MVREESSRPLGAFDSKELIHRDKASLDIFWLKDESIEDSENLPEPDTLAAKSSKTYRRI